jgi:hypothetical protein
MIHEKVLERLNKIREEERPINILLLEDDKCVICEKGCLAFNHKRIVIITEIIPEEDYFLASDGKRYYFSQSSEIHFPM